MKRSTKYVALDVHRDATVASVREESGRVIARGILPTEEAPIVEFFGRMRGSIHVAFEEGTQAQWLHDLLVPLVHRVVVCDRRGERRQGNKADRADADELSDGLRRGMLRVIRAVARTSTSNAAAHRVGSPSAFPIRHRPGRSHPRPRPRFTLPTSPPRASTNRRTERPSRTGPPRARRRMHLQHSRSDSGDCPVACNVVAEPRC